MLYFPINYSYPLSLILLIHIPLPILLLTPPSCRFPSFFHPHQFILIPAGPASTLQICFPPSHSNQTRTNMSDSEGETKTTAEPTYMTPIAKPLAGKKLCKKVFKLVKKAAKSKCIRRGVKEVVKSIRKGEKGLVVLAGNIYPVDVISHIPVYCEDRNIPYIFVPTKEELGESATTKRPTSVIHIVPGKAFEEKKKYDEVYEEVKQLVAAL